MANGENGERVRRTVRDDGPSLRRAGAPSPIRADAPVSGEALGVSGHDRPRGAHVRRSGGSREVIDARGSIDSRTFNETHEISSTTKDIRDRHAAELDSMSRTSWHSRAGQGFDAVPDAGAPRRARPALQRPSSAIGFSGGVMSGGPNYGRPAFPSKVLVVLVAVAVALMAVVAFLLLR